MFRRTMASLALLGAISLGGCAEEQPLIDRTEVNALPKSLFTGEWLYNQTVVDAPNHELPSFIPVGSVNYSGAKRIRWDIQEGWLYARKSYEHIKGATREGVEGTSTGGTGEDLIAETTGEFKGSIVGAWKITGHFDIRRGYNPTTGEEDNTLQEIAGDCKWYDCKYMRVDWSTNAAIDYLFMDHDEDIKKESMPFYFENGEDPRFQPVFDQKAGYIDVTNAMALNPGQATFRWGGRNYTYPLCWLFGHETAECNTIILKLRHSFWRREPNHDFQPRQHWGKVTEWFGFFTGDRLIWDNKFGIVQTHKQQVINRHNIWQNWHLADKPCRTNDDCDKAAGSECDTLQKFYTKDIAVDSDADGLPDSFELAVGLNPNAADSDGDGVLDRYDDDASVTVTWADGVPSKIDATHAANQLPDIQDYWRWTEANQEYRCTIPLQDRIPRPTAYFNTGYFPRDMVCDADDSKTSGHCSPWVWSEDKAVRNDHDSKWAVVHQISNNYDEMWWRIYLRGAYGWSQAKLDKWIETHNPNDGAFDDEDRKTLGRFGDISQPNGPNGLYAFTICANNPPQATDPWPCRFNKKSWPQAKKLIDEGMDTQENRPLVRRGDIRFSKVNYVSGYSQGLLGLGPSHTDPITGENVAGVANVYHLNDVAANSVREMVKLLNGELTAGDFIDGVDITKWIAAVGKNQKNGVYDRAHSYAELQSAYKATVQPWMSRIARQGTPQEIVEARQSSSNRQVKAMMLSQLNASGLFDPAKSRSPGLDLIRGTPIEKRLIDNEVLLGSGVAPTQVQTSELDDTLLAKASLARGGYIKMIDAKAQFKRQMSNRLNMYFQEMADDAMMGLAYRLKNKSDDEVFKTARRIIMRAVLTHEMGHTFGLHHNWAGSEDVVNFEPEYWRLRTNDFKDTKACTGPWTRNFETMGGALDPQPAPKDGDGKLCPFFIKPINSYQLGNDGKALAQGMKSLHEYSYSSIMDYAGRYTIDGGGLGRYDKAAVMYGHVDKVEVYEDSPIKDHTDLGKVRDNWFKEWFEGDGNAVRFYTRSLAFHYTSWWNFMGARMYEESNRKIVDYRDVKELVLKTVVRTTEFGTFYDDGTRLYPRVPYLFCTYTGGDISDNCNTRDYGADQWERMKQHIDQWDSYYPLNSFTRYRHGWSPESYISRHYSRTYRKLKDFNNLYALYQGLFRQWFEPQDVAEFFADPIDGWGSYTLALNDGFDMALRTLAMPDIKGFELDQSPVVGGSLYTDTAFQGAFAPDLTAGRYFTTTYNTPDLERICGLTWWECLHHIGFYTDKIMSLLVLSDSRTYFVGKDTAEDVRDYRISFFDNYATQLIDFFGAALSNDYASYAPVYDDKIASQASVTDAKGNRWRYGIGWRRYADKTQDVNTAGKVPVEPATRFTLKMYMMVIGFLQFQENFDNEFVDRSLMWKSGTNTGWDVAVTDKVDGTVSFRDPFTGYTYVGAKYKDGRGIAQRMINYANKLKARTKFCADDASLTCGTEHPKAEGDLYDYIELMDILTRLGERFRGWASWNWDPFNP